MYWPLPQTSRWAIAARIADDAYMRVRVAACAARLGCAEDAGIDPDDWAVQWRRVWAAAPGWWQAWKANPVPASITDAMIDSQVQQMMPFTRVADHAPRVEPAA